MTDKTLGQVAYESYRHKHAATKAAIGGDPWGDLWDDHQQAWQAAAEAVVDQADQQSAEDWGFHMNKVSEAVIEAAKALVHEQRHGDETSVAGAEWKLAKAVDALEATEGRE